MTRQEKTSLTESTVERLSPSRSINVTAISIGIAITIASGAVAGLLNVRERVATIEANRFTSSDAMKEFGKINAAIAKMPSQVPPEWFKEKVNKIEANQQVIMSEVAALRSAINVNSR